MGYCCNLLYDDDFFDVVTTINTIYFWNDTKKGLEEIYRVLKGDGVFIINIRQN
ncbi:methyltransferase domain-containing protein [Clostridium sp.]|uniref:class I SAM-dependent methyltransferase n=1 Tax=Clostridium sp. TaxID=1506 RepID=UPI0034293F7E